MESNGITNPLFDEVQRCANTQEGLGHFIFFIMRTQELNPPKEYVPWVLFNGVCLASISYYSFELISTNTNIFVTGSQ